MTENIHVKNIFNNLTVGPGEFLDSGISSYYYVGSFYFILDCANTGKLYIEYYYRNSILLTETIEKTTSDKIKDWQLIKTDRVKIRYENTSGIEDTVKLTIIEFEDENFEAENSNEDILKAIKSDSEDANTKLDTLINLAELEESSLTVKYIINAGNTAVFIPDSAGVRLKSLNYGSSNASMGSVHLYDDISTATIDNINDDPKISLFCPSNETIYKATQGYIYFENGIWVRAVDVAEPKANNSDHTPNAVTLTWYKVV